MRALGDKAHALTRELDPKVKWNPVITEPARGHPGSSKAKIWVNGERACLIRDDRGRLISMPGQPWQRPSATAVLDRRGAHRQSNCVAGLILQVTALQLSDSKNSVTSDLQQQGPDVRDSVPSAIAATKL